MEFKISFLKLIQRNLPGAVLTHIPSNIIFLNDCERIMRGVDKGVFVAA